MCSNLKSPEEFKSLMEVSDYFSDEKVCMQYLIQWIWKGEIRCSKCQSKDVYTYSDGKHYKCKSKECRFEFSARCGTIFESTKIPLRKWYMAMYLISCHKKGISSYQLARDLGITQKSSWFMLHRIRESLKQDGVKLEGVVQSDEAFVGGKNKNRHYNKKVKYDDGRMFKDKVPVLGMIEKDGIAKTIVIDNVMQHNIKNNVLSSVKHGSTLITDEFTSYNSMHNHYNHEMVNHSAHQYQNKSGYNTNSIEGFWSHLKRMIIGVYHNIGRKHLQRYCDEQTFRFNTRKMKAGERMALLFSKLNCRLKYKQLIQQA